MTRRTESRSKRGKKIARKITKKKSGRKPRARLAGKRTARRDSRPSRASRPPSGFEAATARQVASCLEQLHRLYPDADCELHWRTPLQLLVATILSAQSTDRRVNSVTPALFLKYRAVKDFAEATPSVLEREIQSTGFFRQKTKSVIGAARRILEDFGGEVPQTMEGLVTLPGVARKTANVVLGTAFGKAVGVVVDTHVKRLAYRLGLSAEQDPVKIEQDLMRALPQREWVFAGHALILHGRRVCHARRPECERCSLAPWCARNGVSDSDPAT